MPGTRISLRISFYVATAEVSACLLVLLLRAAYLYVPGLWEDPHTINFLAAWIPAILSILVAFVPDRELQMRRRILWRFCVIFCGVFYSGVLWHQQVLTDETNSAANAALLSGSVTQANRHSDEKFAGLQQTVGVVETQVTDLGESLKTTTSTLSEAVVRTSEQLNASIGKVGKPDPPPLAKVGFSLWDPTYSPDKPILQQTVSPDKDGNYPIDFVITNVSDVSAESIDVWLSLCDLCSFAIEPKGFEHVGGEGERERHKTYPMILNAGVSMQEHVLIKFNESANAGFRVTLRYSCKTCGKIERDGQSLTLLKGPQLVAAQ
jgi:hypothetical protein